ncbi:hypothetical protein LIER_21703 [Lithospermum erythrorhizon]|uniref:Uncharacterized protein n=1 Tax=Lithospermum erythrorhizon TaxID=34254 RepID=A0AAV3QR51_LITER
MDLARQGAILLEEDKVSPNHTTLIVIRPTEVKVPNDFWQEVSKTPQDEPSILLRKDDELTKALEGLTLPLAYLVKVASAPLKGFVPPASGSKDEHGTMGPKAYDLLVKAGYDPKEGKTLGELPPEVMDDKVHGLNETHKML